MPCLKVEQLSVFGERLRSAGCRDDSMADRRVPNRQAATDLAVSSDDECRTYHNHSSRPSFFYFRAQIEKYTLIIHSTPTNEHAR
jgi:hypothetical protein